MLIIPDYDTQALAAPKSFRDGIQAAINILDATFTANITVKIAVGYGEAGALGPLPGQNYSEGDFLLKTAVNYSQLRTDLIKTSDIDSTSTSLPNTQSVNGQQSFIISSAQERLFRLLPPVNNTASDDGKIGIGTDFTGNELIAAALHEITHAPGRTDGSSLDLFRFTTTGQRLFTGGTTAQPAYFSMDNGVKDLADYGQDSDPGDFLNPPASNKTPNDPFNEFIDATTFPYLTAVDIQEMDALGFSVTASWNVAASGDFAVGANWKSGFVPVPATDVRLAVAGTYTVTSSADETVNSLTTAKGVTLAINGSTFTITNGTGTGANAGTIAVGDGASLSVGGTFKNTGTIELESVFVPTSLLITADFDLQGDGNVALSDSNQNTVAAAVGAGPVTLTNVGNTISGAGSIGTGDGTLSLVNDKTIDATGTINALVIDTGNPVSNSGKLEATGVGGLLIEDTIGNTATGEVYAAASGSTVYLDGGNIDDGKVNIVAGATLEATGGTSALSDVAVTDKGTLDATLGSTLTLANTTVNASRGIIEAYDDIEAPPLNSEVVLSNATITGGTLTAADGGEIATAPGTNSTLNGVTVSSDSTVTVTDGSTLTLGDTINNDGTIALESTGDATEVAISGNVTLQGGGDVNLSDNSNNTIVSNGSTAKLTNADAISGAGSIGNGDTTLTIANKDTIDATSTNPLVINTGSNTISSPGMLEATNGGTLIVDSPVIKSVTGTAQINNGTLEFAASSNVPVIFSGSAAAAGSAASNFITLDNPVDSNSTQYTIPDGINNLGQVSGLVGYADVGFIYSNGIFNTILSIYEGRIGGINDSGQVVWAEYNVASDADAGFLYSNGVNTQIGDSSKGFNFNPFGINDEDQIVGSYEDNQAVFHGFVYSNNSATTIDDPLGYATVARDINNSGDIVGTYLNRPGEISNGFLYNDGSFKTIDDPLAGTNSTPNNGTFATGINDAGDIVGYYYDSNGVSHGFFYNGSSFTTIDDPSAASGDGGTVITGINDTDQIVGYYGDANGQHGFEAQVSAPNALILNEAPQYTGTVSDFGAGDTIDLTDINDATLKPLKYTPNSGNTGGTLTANDGINIAHIALLGQYMAAGFHDTADSGTGTVITYTPPSSQSSETLFATRQHT